MNILFLLLLLIGFLLTAPARASHIAGGATASLLTPYLTLLRNPALGWNRRGPASVQPVSHAPGSAALGTRAEVQQLLEAYAPRFWFHPEEAYGPVDASQALRESSLWTQVQHRRFPRRIFARGQVDFTYLTAKDATDPGLFLKYEAPIQDFRRVKTLDDAPMYWKLSQASALRGPGLAAPAPGHERFVIEYWYYSLFNFSTDVGIGNHEGDWEGASMLVEAWHDGSAMKHRLLMAYYSAHEHGQWLCPEELSWTSHQPGQGHPEAFSAVGTHATFAAPGKYGTFPASVFFKDRAARGRAWDSWKNLTPIALEPFYGFRGRWGSPSPIAFMSGPQAPGPDFKAKPQLASDGTLVIPGNAISRCKLR